MRAVLDGIKIWSDPEVRPQGASKDARLPIQRVISYASQEDVFGDRHESHPVRAVAPAAFGRQGKASGDPAARARRRWQRPDRAGTVLGAAYAGCRVPVAERTVSLRH